MPGNSVKRHIYRCFLANDERYSESYKMLHETAKTLLAYDE